MVGTVKLVARALGADRTMQKLIAVERALENRREPHDDTRTYFSQRWEENFDSQGGVYEKWQGLSPATVKERNALGYGDGPILVRSGATRTHFLDQAQSADVTESATTWDFASGNPPWMFTHHFGFEKIRPGVPPRPMWDMNDEDGREVWEIFDDFVDEVIARYF